MQSFKQYLGEDLRKWFKQKWVRMDTKGNIKGDCAREPGEGKPRCLPQAKAHAIGKEARASAARRKRKEDPNPERRGAPINVRTEACWTGYKAIGLKKKGNRMVPNCVKEGSAAAIAAATAIAKKKSGNYDAKGFRKTPYKNPDAPNVKSNAERRKEINEDGIANVAGGGAIAGIGVGKDGEPGVHMKKKKTPILMSIRRKQPKA